ncbi:uncharacterized protein MELLADRAFT_112881 [Melampsora larici-populina 98AG31]|uniref:Uncharacterized protein n=1 Tax=Melampsora larici-populina (strain 98AG31 / pathotype 3-4-7) TaxID=747676 RepID=F4S7Z9_MELLP|nr:uncharacterized protein MELLADRAFT_112881 [Melampsora larici-populina 98AG31]EGF99239.1 hypothetical protein MELLADRAFT_112881 [Melampsora larici-populina 98AG31]
MLNLVMVYFLRLFFEFPVGEDFKGFIRNYFQQLPKTILFVILIGLMFLAITYFIGSSTPMTTTNNYLIELDTLPPPVISTRKPLLPLIIITAPLDESFNTNTSASRESNRKPGSDNNLLKVPPHPRLRTSRPRSHYPVDSMNLVSGTSFTNLPGYSLGLRLINEALGSLSINHKDV